MIFMWETKEGVIVELMRHLSRRHVLIENIRGHSPMPPTNLFSTGSMRYGLVDHRLAFACATLSSTMPFF